MIRHYRLACACLVAALALLFMGAAPPTTWLVHPGDSIQAAINAAAAGDIVVVEPGTYNACLTLNKSLTLRGTNPDDRAVVAATIIDGNSCGSTIQCDTVAGAPVIAGLNIKGGSGTLTGGMYRGGGVYCRSTALAIRNCIINNNSVTDYGGGVFMSVSGSDGARITGCTFYNNVAYQYGGAIYLNSCSPTVDHCVIYSNTATDGGGISCYAASPTLSHNSLHNNSAAATDPTYAGGIRCRTGSHPTMSDTIVSSSARLGVYVDGTSTLAVTYSNVTGSGTGNYDGMADPVGTNGNISANPNFVSHTDLHLLSTAGHWTPDGWVEDVLTSPCVDAGTPATDYSLEPVPHGKHVNMGAYGGTAEASKSPRRIINVGSGVCWASIQAAIDHANPADVIEVRRGVYQERISFKGKAITVRSVDPEDPATVKATEINGGAAGAVVEFTGTEGPDSVLSGFTITNGTGHDNGGGSCYGGGIYCLGAPTITNNVICDNHSNHAAGGIGVFGAAIIRNNIIVENTAPFSAGVGLYGGAPQVVNNVIGRNVASSFGGGIRCNYENPVIAGNLIVENAAPTGAGLDLLTCTPTLRRNTIAGNTATGNGGGIRCASATVTMENTIIAENLGGGGINVTAGAPPAMQHCDVWNNTGGDFVGMPDPTGADGNISKDPLFVFAGEGDYHLKSCNGHWSPDEGWIKDTVTSPCIDAGLAAVSCDREPKPNGACINMGYDGNTKEASKSSMMSSRSPGSSRPVARDTTVLITFNAPVRQASAQSHFSLVQDGNPIAGTFSWPIANKRMRFTPSALLAAEQTFTVRLAKGIVKTNDDTFNWGEMFRFRTNNVGSMALAVTAAASSTGSGTAQIRVCLSRAASVQVRIMNLAGHEVAVLPEQALEAGTHTLLWSGRSSAGTVTPPGRYLVRLSANESGGGRCGVPTPLLRR